MQTPEADSDMTQMLKGTVIQGEMGNVSGECKFSKKG